MLFFNCSAMLSNPPLNYGPDLGAASADPVETENYEALLNLGNARPLLLLNLKLRPGQLESGRAALFVGRLWQIVES